MRNTLDEIIELQTLHYEEEGRNLKERQSNINNKISGYCILWNDKNSKGQYFTTRTDFGLLGQVNSLFMFSGNELHLLGKVKLSKDETGVLVEAELDVSSRKSLTRAEAVNILQEKGMLQIKANPDVEKIKDYYGDVIDENGHIKYWPIADIMLVPIPGTPK